MAKILISSLGKGIKGGNYNVAKYKIAEDERIYESNSIAKVLTEHLGIDKLLLLGTSGSSWDMIADNFGDEELSLELMEKVDTSKVGSTDLVRLDKVIDKHLGTDGSKSWIIDYGVNEAELWNNFSILLEMSKTFQPGDEIFLDITHAFRSLPMMSFVMTEFASQVSDIRFELSGIYYGMFEYREDPQNPEKGITPIVDISIIYRLHKWIRAIDAMKNYGNLEPLVNVLGEESGEGKDVKNIFVQLNNNIKMANLASIKQFVSSASKKINALKKTDNKIISLLSKDIEEFVNRLDKEKMSDFQFELAKWFRDNKQYALSYIALAEAIITKACETRGYNIESKEGREAGKIYMGMTKYADDFLPRYKGSISDIRNNIAHQLDKRKSMVNQDVEKLDYFLAKFADFMEE